MPDISQIKEFFSRKNYFLHRHYFIIFFVIIVAIVLFMRITSVWQNQKIQELAVKKSIKEYTKTTERGGIFDRNSVNISGNNMISRVILDPNALQITGYTDDDGKITSIWRINSLCNLKKYKKDCKNKTLADRARKLKSQNKTYDNFLTQVDFLNILVDILEADKDLITKVILKKQKSSQYYLAKKDLPFFGEIMEKVKAFKNEKFLVCKTKKLTKSKFKEFFTGTTKEKDITKCWLENPKNIAIQNYYKRFYSQAETLTPLIGVVNKKGVGVFGIERSFDEYLRSSKNIYRVIKPVNSWQNPYKNKQDNPKKNNDLHLNIDYKAQFHLFSAIKKSVIEKGAKSGSGIIVNKNGEILALASYPTSDANLGIKSDDNYSHYINRVLSDNIDIASMIKPLILLMALEKGVVNFDSQIDISTGAGGFKAKDEDSFIALSDIIKYSHRLGSIKVGEKLENFDIFDYLNSLQFGKSPNLLPQIESSGLLRNPYYWSKVDKIRLSFGGYGVISATLAQIARAYLVFLNDGKIKNLKLFKNTPNEEMQVFNAKNIEFITKAMIKVVNEGGTGKRAKLDNFIAAGKTGTSQLLINGKYSNSHHNTMFAGFAPNPNPQYLMLVNISDPDKYYYDGGSVAAPIFKEVMSKILK